MSIKKSSPDTSYAEYLLIFGVALIILLSHIMGKDAVTLLKLTLSYNGMVSGTVKDIPCSMESEEVTDGMFTRDKMTSRTVSQESISRKDGNSSYCRNIIIEGDILSDAQIKLLNELFSPKKSMTYNTKEDENNKQEFSHEPGNNPLDKTPKTSGSKINSIKKRDSDSKSKRVKHPQKQNKGRSDREKRAKGKESLIISVTRTEKGTNEATFPEGRYPLPDLLGRIALYSLFIKQRIEYLSGIIHMGVVWLILMLIQGVIKRRINSLKQQDGTPLANRIARILPRITVSATAGAAAFICADTPGLGLLISILLIVSGYSIYNFIVQLPAVDRRLKT